VNATSGADTGSVTVTCQASLRELRAAALWLYLHDRAAQYAILLVLLGALVIFVAWGRIVGQWSAVAEHPSWISGRAIGSAIWLLAFTAYRAWLLWTLPERAWQRLQREGSTTLTVSATGLSWHKAARQNEVPWEHYAGYALLPDALLLLSGTPYIVPRSTVSPVDFERVLAIVKAHLQPLTHFDSQKKPVVAAPPAR
jgi:hypothetical protein